MTASRIVIDLHMVGERETGNETYARELAEALVTRADHEYLLYTPRPEALGDLLRPHARAFRDVPSPVRLLWTYPRMLRQDGARLVHVHYAGPIPSPCPLVVTVHDLSFRIFPEFFSPRDRAVLGTLVPRTLKRAAAVLVPSESALRDILRFYPMPAERITVTPEAAAAHFRPQPADEVSRVKTQYGLAARYVLAVGNLQPRKNLERLLSAFANLASRVDDVQLVVVGQKAWRGDGLERLVMRMGLAARVRLTGYVPASDLAAIYSGAAVFCYPSLYEGFGLPVLEAMACGAPVVTSDSSSLPEVAGDAAILVDPTSVGKLSLALESLLSSEVNREALRRRGLARAAKFSWRRTAALTAGVYDAVLRAGHDTRRPLHQASTG